MAAFFQMLNTQAVLLAYLLCGVLCRRLHIITPHSQQNFTDLVLSVLMPCMVFNSFQSVTWDMLRNSLSVLGLSLGISLAAMAAGRLIFRRAGAGRAGVLRYAVLVNNAGFAGLPLARETFGAEGALYASVFLIPARIFMWSAGVTMISGQRPSAKKLWSQLAKNPNIVAVFLGLARGLSGLTFPPFIESALSHLDACVSPLSMVIIGAIVAGVPWKGLFEKDVWLYAAVRLLAMPLAALAAGRLLGFAPVALGSVVILTAMPAGTTVPLLAARYGKDAVFASKLLLVSTVLSLLTVPALMVLL